MNDPKGEDFTTKHQKKKKKLNWILLYQQPNMK